MFELVRAYEVAKNEENKLLRYFYLRYTKRKLKRIFFDKFNIETITLNRDLIREFLQVYSSIEQDRVTRIHSRVNNTYPHIFSANIQTESIEMRYYGFGIRIQIIGINDFNVSILFTPTNLSDFTIYPDTRYLNISVFKPIILMAIYNYCVSYIYGYESDLYIDNHQYIDTLYDIHI